MSKLQHKQIICPHCWNEFYDDDALYISKNFELVGDPVIADPTAQKRYAPHEVSADRKGVVRDLNGTEMTERACPRCHLQIPHELLESRPFFISVSGAPSAGKTYFLASLLHQLAYQMAKQFKYSLAYCDSIEARELKRMENILFRGSRDQDTFLEKSPKNPNYCNNLHL